MSFDVIEDIFSILHISSSNQSLLSWMYVLFVIVMGGDEFIHVGCQFWRGIALIMSWLLLILFVKGIHMHTQDLLRL